MEWGGEGEISPKGTSYFVAALLISPICGEGEIRTRGGREPSDVFKTSALDHYATSP
jgi:hypothetical protein